VPRPTVALIGLVPSGYAAGFLVSIYLAVGSIITFGIGCVLIGRTLWVQPPNMPVQPTGGAAALN
jgi:hypothetical protein